VLGFELKEMEASKAQKEMMFSARVYHTKSVDEFENFLTKFLISLINFKISAKFLSEGPPDPLFHLLYYLFLMLVLLICDSSLQCSATTLSELLQIF